MFVFVFVGCMGLIVRGLSYVCAFGFVFFSADCVCVCLFVVCLLYVCLCLFSFLWVVCACLLMVRLLYVCVVCVRFCGVCV